MKERKRLNRCVHTQRLFVSKPSLHHLFSSSFFFFFVVVVMIMLVAVTTSLTIVVALVHLRSHPRRTSSRHHCPQTFWSGDSVCTESRTETMRVSFAHSQVLSNRLKLAHTEIRLNAHQRMHRTYVIVHVCMTEHIALVKRTHAFICIHSTCAKRAFACVDRHDTADANPLAGALQVDITTASFSFPKAIPSSLQAS